MRFILAQGLFSHSKGPPQSRRQTCYCRPRPRREWLSGLLPPPDGLLLSLRRRRRHGPPQLYFMSVIGTGTKILKHEFHAPLQQFEDKRSRKSVFLPRFLFSLGLLFERPFAICFNNGKKGRKGKYFCCHIKTIFQNLMNNLISFFVN